LAERPPAEVGHGLDPAPPAPATAPIVAAQARQSTPGSLIAVTGRGFATPIAGGRFVHEGDSTDCSFSVLVSDEAVAEDGVLNIVRDIPGDWSRQRRRILREIFPKQAAGQRPLKPTRPPGSGR
jgi:hypothetical protein